MMKKLMHTIRLVLEEIKKDIDVYIVIRRYNRVSRKTFMSIFTIFATVLFSLISICYAQTSSKPLLIAPEPSAMIIASTGILGWLIRFARKRFHEFKRVLDIVTAAIGLVVAFPVIGFTALIIKIVSPGPIFFKQERVGWEGEVFDIYKIRTMRVDAEKYTGPVWAKEDDPRLIKFGKIIRKLHIDELPQLYNVLKGDMSIVGPRPERPVFVEKLSEEIIDYKKRVNVRPGITGLAQVRHKYDETIADVRKKVKYDLLYIREMCFMVDLRILARTVIVAARGKGAR